MSRIDDVIADHCPDGVRFRSLGTVAEVRAGWGFPKTYQGRADGDYPFLKVADMNLPGNELVMTTANNYVDAATVRTLGCKPAPGGTVVFPKIGAAIATNKKRILARPSCYDNNVFGVIPSEALVPRFLLYLFQVVDLSTFAHDSGALPSIRKSTLDAYRIPVPPLEVQRAIVQILDTSTELEAELEAKLEAELEARRVQYQYYRDALLTFGDTDGVRRVPMYELGEFIRGRRFTKDDVVPTGIASIHYGEIYTHYGTSTTATISQVRTDLAPRLRFAHPSDVVVAAVGETVEDVGKAVAWLGDGEVAVHDDCFVFRHSLNPQFVAYWFQTTALNAEKAKYVSRAKVKRLSGESLGKLTIPVPSPEEQARIVDILNTFVALVEDLSVGLPAELAARRQQYEYYRERLLTFEEASV